MVKIAKYEGLIFFMAGMLIVLIFNWGVDYTSTNKFCEGCHVHPQASQSWRLGAHFDNKSGVVINCVDCHLPPGGTAYLMAKTSTGLRDVMGMFFKDTDISIAFLSGKLTQSKKKLILSSLENGDVNFVVGTHALLSSPVKFKNLAFVIIDEEHKFGVNQRARLIEKGINIEFEI